MYCVFEIYASLHYPRYILRYVTFNPQKSQNLFEGYYSSGVILIHYAINDGILLMRTQITY